MENIIAAISQVGFPVVCCYLLINKIITRLDNISNNLDNLQQTLLYINTAGEHARGNGRKSRLKRRTITYE